MTKAVDLTPITDKYAGKFVALNKSMSKVYASGKSAESVIKSAEKQGHRHALITFIPKDNSAYIL